MGLKIWGLTAHFGIFGGIFSPDRGPGHGHGLASRTPSPPSPSHSGWPPACDRGSKSRSDCHAPGPGHCQWQTAVRQIPSRPSGPPAPTAATLP